MNWMFSTEEDFGLHLDLQKEKNNYWGLVFAKTSVAKIL